ALHRQFAKLHGTGPSPADAAGDLPGLYRDYAEATVKASQMLHKHGKDSPQFVSADVASMRLFHRVKKLQGLKKARPS
ncbi:MAG TPA: hypothetical protein VGG66_01230, partial [Rhizomicrobium sp.]